MRTQFALFTAVALTVGGLNLSITPSSAYADDNAKAHAEESKDAAKHSAREAGHAVKDEAKDLSSDARQAGERMGDKAQSLKDDLKTRMSSTAVDFKDDTDKDNVRTVLAKVTEAATDKDKVSDLNQYVVDSDRKRLKDVKASDDFDKSVSRLRDEWKSKYDSDLDVKKDKLLGDRAQVVQGEVRDPQALNDWPLDARGNSSSSASASIGGSSSSAHDSGSAQTAGASLGSGGGSYGSGAGAQGSSSPSYGTSSSSGTIGAGSTGASAGVTSPSSASGQDSNRLSGQQASQSGPFGQSSQSGTPSQLGQSGQSDQSGQSAASGQSSSTSSQGDAQQASSSYSSEPRDDHDLKKGDRIAVVRIPAEKDLPELTVSMVRQGGDWKLDIPDKVDADKLQSNLRQQIDRARDDKDKWPDDQDKASRYLAHRVLMALYDVDANRGSSGSAASSGDRQGN